LGYFWDSRTAGYFMHSLPELLRYVAVGALFGEVVDFPYSLIMYIM
jgi:hypothetical protein